MSEIAIALRVASPRFGRVKLWFNNKACCSCVCSCKDIYHIHSDGGCIGWAKLADENLESAEKQIIIARVRRGSGRVIVAGMVAGWPPDSCIHQY